MMLMKFSSLDDFLSVGVCVCVVRQVKNFVGREKKKVEKIQKIYLASPFVFAARQRFPTHTHTDNLRHLHNFQ